MVCRVTDCGYINGSVTDIDLLDKQNINVLFGPSCNPGKVRLQPLEPVKSDSYLSRLDP